MIHLKNRILKYAGFKYEGLNNLGDQIQSIAAEKFLPHINVRFNRDTLSYISSENQHLIIMNGWFTHNPKSCFPPADSIKPVFWGFHISDWNDSWDHFLAPESINFLKKNEPIGCRDTYTANQLKKAKINTFTSKCLTLTFPKRENIPKHGWNIVVDVPIPLPNFIKDSAIYVSHRISPEISEKKKIKQAKNLLNIYNSRAKLIITTRLHCALPCIAMGIPVIFLGNPEDYRTSLIRDLGLKIYNLPKNISLMEREEYIFTVEKIWSEIEWDPKPLEFENEKREIIDRFQKFLHKKIHLFQNHP